GAACVRVPARGGAGEGDLAAGGVLQDLVGDLRGRAHDEVGDARRQPGLDHAFKNLNETQGRLAGRLADDRAAGRQRRGDLARLERYGEVPRADGADDADRVLDDQVPFAGSGVRDHLAVGALALLGEPL